MNASVFIIPEATEVKMLLQIHLLYGTEYTEGEAGNLLTQIHSIYLPKLARKG